MDIEAKIRRNSLDPRIFIGVLILMLNVMMGLMFSLIKYFPNFNPIIIAVISIASAFVVLVPFLSYSTYTVNGKGILQESVPYLRGFTLMKNKTEFYPWSEVTSYKADSDLNRSLFEKQYIKVFFKNGKRINILEGKSEAESLEFFKFKEVFESLVDNYNNTSSYTISQDQKAGDSSPTVTGNRSFVNPPIKHLKGFYSTFHAKILTLIFLILTLAVAYPLYLGYGSASSYFRFLVILIPGTGYMFYRSFIKKA